MPPVVNDGDYFLYLGAIRVGAGYDGIRERKTRAVWLLALLIESILP